MIEFTDIPLLSGQFSPDKLKHTTIKNGTLWAVYLKDILWFDLRNEAFSVIQMKKDILSIFVSDDGNYCVVDAKESVNLCIKGNGETKRIPFPVYHRIKFVS